MFDFGGFKAAKLKPRKFAIHLFIVLYLFCDVMLVQSQSLPVQPTTRPQISLYFMLAASFS